MMLKQFFLYAIVCSSLSCFSQNTLSIDQTNRDSLWYKYDLFMLELDSLPIDTSKHYPTKFENFELIWVRNVAHSHAEIQKGDERLFDKDKMLIYRPYPDVGTWFDGMGRGYFIGDDYYVISFGYNWNMSTIFNDTYYYKRKKITSLTDLYGRGAIEYGEPSGPLSGSYLDYSIFTAEIDSSLRVEYNTFSDSISTLPAGILDTNAIYKLRYHYGISSGFDLYSDNENYEYLYQGNDIVFPYQDIMKLINSSRYGGDFPDWVIYGNVIKYTSHISRHGGTFDIEAQHIYYFEKVE